MSIGCHSFQMALDEKVRTCGALSPWSVFSWIMRLQRRKRNDLEFWCTSLRCLVLNVIDFDNTWQVALQEKQSIKWGIMLPAIRIMLMVHPPSSLLSKQGEVNFERMWRCDMSGHPFECQNNDTNYMALISIDFSFPSFFSHQLKNDSRDNGLYHEPIRK